MYILAENSLYRIDPGNPEGKCGGEEIVKSGAKRARMHCSETIGYLADRQAARP